MQEVNVPGKNAVKVRVLKAGLCDGNVVLHMIDAISQLLVFANIVAAYAHRCSRTPLDYYMCKVPYCTCHSDTM